MRKFDTKVQKLKYKVLREAARQAWEDKLPAGALSVPEKLAPGDEATKRCCVYKERAILAQRVKLAMGGSSSNSNVVEVIDIACDECPVGGYTVTDACRGCIAHRCESACPKGAITFDNQLKAGIDRSKCIECGRCAAVCPYSAINHRVRPCEASCKLKAISVTRNGDDDDKSAVIDNDKCISCGACIYHCPFGAISDKSYIVNVIDILKKSLGGTAYKVYAVVAPAIASQFTYAEIGQVITGIRKLGFHTAVEAALGADIVAYNEAYELCEKGFLTSSCCPAFTELIRRRFPSLCKNISSNVSPAAAVSKYIKKYDPNARVIFIGPCIAKKAEYRRDELRPYIDSVITFEELQALFDSRSIDITVLEKTELNNASCFGRIFARSGGLSEAVNQAIKEQKEDFTVVPEVCAGIDACRVALTKAEKGLLKGNFIEGMACPGGCIGGPGCLTHSEQNRLKIDEYAKLSYEKSIRDAASQLIK